MKNRTAVRHARTITLLGVAATTLLTLTGIATASYPGLDRAGNIHVCFSAGNTRIVDHFPCKPGETALSWNAQGRDGSNGQDGTDGKPGATGATGAAGMTGAAGAAGPAGTPGAAGKDGTPGATGQPGPAGQTGAVGPEGPAGADGPTGPAGPAGAPGAEGPAGPAGASSGSLQFARISNSTDPDCAFSSPVGTSTAGGCTMTALGANGVPLPEPTSVAHFTARFSTPQTGGHIYAMTTNASTHVVDTVLLCTIPAGTMTCTQADSAALSAQPTFGLEFDGDRSWTSVTVAYTLSVQ